LILEDFDGDAVRAVAREAVQQRAGELQELYDRVLRTEAGKPVEDAKAALAREWRSAFGAELTDPELSDTAAVLASGTRIKVRLDTGTLCGLRTTGRFLAP
jgi:hypothetical protein